jgi:glycosyltransferase involved in cell wall biosynthesis
MAAACPAVATNVGDVVDMVAPENRPFIVPASDESAFSVALQKLANDTDGRAKIGSANQAKARSCFAEVDMIGAYANLYAEPLASAAALM